MSLSSPECCRFSTYWSRRGFAWKNRHHQQKSCRIDLNRVKGNLYLEKALLTGVTRISHEGMLSDLNNITTFDIFEDQVYNSDYGLTESEMTELSAACHFELSEARLWYNGIKVEGQDIY
jgi:hypothetical protein